MRCERETLCTPGDLAVKARARPEPTLALALACANVRDQDRIEPAGLDAAARPGASTRSTAARASSAGSAIRALLANPGRASPPTGTPLCRIHRAVQSLLEWLRGAHLRGQGPAGAVARIPLCTTWACISALQFAQIREFTLHKLLVDKNMSAMYT